MQKVLFPDQYPDLAQAQSQWLCEECYALMRNYLLLAEYRIDYDAEPELNQRCDSCKGPLT